MTGSYLSDEKHFMFHRTDKRLHIRIEISESKHPAKFAGSVQAEGGMIMARKMFSWYSLGALIIVEGTMDQHMMNLFLRTIFTPICELFFLEVMSTTSMTFWCVIKLAVYARGSKNTRTSSLYSFGQQSFQTWTCSRICEFTSIGFSCHRFSTP